MGVRSGASVAGNVLENRQNTAVLQPLGHGASDRSDLSRFGSIGPVANDGIGAGNRDIRQRQAIDGYPEICKIRRDQPRAQPCRREAKRMVDVVKRPKNGSGRIDRPMRRAETLDPSALLVDQDRRIRFADGFAQLLNKKSNLFGCFNVPFE